jgi:hypothetical protein
VLSDLWLPARGGTGHSNDPARTPAEREGFSGKDEAGGVCERGVADTNTAGVTMPRPPSQPLFSHVLQFFRAPVMERVQDQRERDGDKITREIVQ